MRMRNLQMLSTKRDFGSTETSFDNAVDETGKRRNAANEESGHGTPVATVLGRVAVNTVEVVHVRDRHVTLADNEVAIDG